MTSLYFRHFLNLFNCEYLIERIWKILYSFELFKIVALFFEHETKILYIFEKKKEKEGRLLQILETMAPASLMLAKNYVTEETTGQLP